MFMIYDNISIIFYSDSTSNCNKIYTIIIITILISLYVYFGNTVHIKIVQIMHRSCKLILKDDKKITIQYYTQYNSIVKATKYHATKPIYQIEVETETNRYHE